MVEGIFRLADRRVGSIMTNRTEIIWLDISDTGNELRRKIGRSRHSRFPVCDGDLDRILGVVQAKDLLLKSLIWTVCAWTNCSSGAAAQGLHKTKAQLSKRQASRQERL